MSYVLFEMNFYFQFDAYVYLVKQKHVGESMQADLLSLLLPREDPIKGEHYIILGRCNFYTF